MIVAVKFTLYCFSCCTLLLVYKRLANAHVTEQYNPENEEQVLQLSRRSIDDLLKWDQALRRRKYEEDKRFLLLYKRAVDAEDDESEENRHVSERRGGTATKHAVSKKTSIRAHKATNHKPGKHYGSKKTHIIHSLTGLSPIMESESAVKIEAVSQNALKATKEIEYDSSEVPGLLKQFHSSWHDDNDRLSRFSDQVRQHTVEKVSDRKDRISKKERHGAIVNEDENDDTDENTEKSGDDDTEGSGAAESSNGSGETVRQKTETKKHHAEEEDESGDTSVEEEKEEEAGDVINSEGDTNTTVKGKSDKENKKPTEYRKVKHVSKFSQKQKSFSEMIVEDVMKRKGSNHRLPARNIDTVGTVHQPVTAQRILPFLGNRQTSKVFQNVSPVVSKGPSKYNKLIKPRHFHHHHHHAHRVFTSAATNISILSNNNLLKRRVVWPEPALPFPSLFQANSIARKVIPAGRSAVQPSVPPGRPLVKGIVNLKGNLVGSKGVENIPEHETGYVPARLSLKPFVPPPKPTIYDKILKSVAKMGEKQGIKPMKPLDTNKASAFLNSYYRHVKELSQDPQYASPALDSIFSSNSSEAAPAPLLNMNIPQLLAAAANFSQPKQAIPGYNSMLTNATSYGGWNPGPAYTKNYLGYSSYSPPQVNPDRRTLKNNKNWNSKKPKKPAMRCYKGHCTKLRKYADVSGSKKDVLIGKLVPTMDPEDQGGGEFSVADINGAQLLEESAAVDVDGLSSPPENEEENEEEKKEELKGSKRDFTGYSNSDLLKEITTQQYDVQPQTPTAEDAEATETVSDDTRLLGTTADVPETNTVQADTRSLPAESEQTVTAGNEMMDFQHVEETADGSLIAMPQERKSRVVQSKNLDQIEAIKRPLQMKPKYFANEKPEQREYPTGEKYMDTDEFGRRRKSETGIPLGEIEIDNTNVPGAVESEPAPQGNTYAPLEKQQQKSIEINDFEGNKQSEVSLVQDIENKEFQDYLQTIKNKEAAKDRDFQDYIQSFKNKELGVSERAAKKDKYAIPHTIPVNEYQQENTHPGKEYGVSVTRSVPYKLLHQNEGVENYRRKVADYRAAHGLPMGDYARAEKKTLDYSSFAKSPAVNEYSVSNEEGNEYVAAHNKKSTFDEVSNAYNNPSLKANIEKEIPNEISNRYTNAERASPKEASISEEVPINYEALSRETEQPVNRISNAEMTHERPSYQEKQTIEYAPSDDRIPTGKEVVTEIENPRNVGGKYGFIDDTPEKGSNSVRRTVSNYNRGETVLPYTASNSENFSYERKQYTSPARANFLARQRAAYIAKKRYQAAVAARYAAAKKKQLNRRTATPEKLMAMTRNPSMMSRFRLGPLGPAVNAKSSPVGNIEQELRETESENYELSKLIKGQIQDPTSFEQQNLLRSEQNRKTMVERMHPFPRGMAGSQGNTPWENRFLSGVERPQNNMMSRTLEERGPLLGGYMNFGKRNADGSNDVFTTNEAKTLIPVMKNRRLNNMSAMGNIVKYRNLLSQRKAGLIAHNRTANASKKMEVPNFFSDLGTERALDANLLSGVDTPLPIREKEPKSVKGETKNKISSVQDLATESRIKLLKKLKATKEDLLAARLADRRLYKEKEKSEDVPSAMYFHKEGSIADDITAFGHNDLEESTAHERKLTKFNHLYKQDGEMNIVEDEGMAKKDSDPADIEGDVGEDKKLADIIAHATRKNHEDAQAKSTNSEKKEEKKGEEKKGEKNPDIKEHNETVSMTGAAVLTAEPYKGNNLKEHKDTSSQATELNEDRERKLTPKPVELMETEEKIFPKVAGENDLNETVDTKTEEKPPKETTQKNLDKEKVDTKDDVKEVKKLKELEKQLKKSEEKKIEKVGSIQKKLKEMAGLETKGQQEGEVSKEEDVKEAIKNKGNKKETQDQQPTKVPKDEEVNETIKKQGNGKETDVKEMKEEEEVKESIKNKGNKKETDIKEAKEKHTKKQVSNDGKNKQDKQPHDLEENDLPGNKEFPHKNAERIQHEERKAKEFAAKEWQKHHGGDGKMNGFIGKDGSEVPEFAGTVKIKDRGGEKVTGLIGKYDNDDLDAKKMHEFTATLKIKELSNKATQKEFGGKNIKEAKIQNELLDKDIEKDVFNKEIQQEFDKGKEKQTAHKEKQNDENGEKEVSLKELQQQFDESSAKDDQNKENQKESESLNGKDGKEKENENQLEGKKEQEEFRGMKVKESNAEEEQKSSEDKKKEENVAENSMKDNNEKSNGKEQKEKKKVKEMKSSAQNIETNKEKHGGKGEGTKTIKPDDKKEDETRAKELDFKVPTTATITIDKGGEVNVQDKEENLSKTPTKEEAAAVTEKEKDMTDQKADQTSSGDKEELTGIMEEVEKEKALSDQKTVTLTAQEIKNHKGGKKPKQVSEFKENGQKGESEKSREDETKLGEDAEQNTDPAENGQKVHESNNAQGVEATENEMMNREKETKDAGLEEEGKINEITAKAMPVSDSEKENSKESIEKTESVGGKSKANKSFEQSKNREGSRQEQQSVGEEEKTKEAPTSEVANEAKEERIAEKEREREKVKEEEKEAIKEIDVENEEVKLNEKEAENKSTNSELKSKDVKEMDTEKSAAQAEPADEDIMAERMAMMIANKKKHQEAKEQEVGNDQDVDRKRKGRKDKSMSVTEDDGTKLKEAPENSDTVLDAKESKLKETMKKIADVEATADDNKVNENQEQLESNSESENKESAPSSGSKKKGSSDPEEKKLKELLNKKVEEIMERFRKEKETGQQQDTSNDQTNTNINEETNQKHHSSKETEEGESNDENAKPIENSVHGDEKHTKEGIDETERTNERQEIATEVDNDLKADIDHNYLNKTDSAYTKDMIEGMSNPFADIGSLPDGPAFDKGKESKVTATSNKDINAELAEIIRSQATAETNLRAELSKTQRASARDSLPKADSAAEEVDTNESSSQVSKRGFYRYTNAKKLRIE